LEGQSWEYFLKFSKKLRVRGKAAQAPAGKKKNKEGH